MTARLTSALIVSAMVRRVAGAGGNAAIVARGDAQAGAIILLCAEKGVLTSVRERVLVSEERYVWAETGPQNIDNTSEIDAYLERRRSRDADLWVVELDIANAERFADETIGVG